ncbi:MAG: hypothetical protein HN909_00450, partial [Phycisphaerales bacterium]|nr:hypothetical protein [Phycisphaerales bacterium]
IVFTSTREPKYCMCNVHIMANLYRMKPDGANIHQIGRSTLFEGHPAVLPDGRIIYDRWEYVDRNFGDAQGLWVVNPDGTNHAIFYGNNTPSPGGVIDPQPIPGSKKIVAIFSSCHDRAWGAMAMIDRTKGVDGKAPVVRTWPESAKALVRDPGQANGVWDTFCRVKPRYEDPKPLDENFILVSREVAPGKEIMGLFLVDTFGNEILIHTEGAGCFDPMLIATRAKPHPLALHRDFNGKNGRFYVMNAHEGTHMEGVKPGDVKFLRVCETPAKLAWTVPKWGGQGVHRPAINWHDFSTKRVLGTVPIESDGSCHFEVPHDRFVFFQLLDENRQLVQTMRSGVIVQSGELLGCVGCHEDRIKSSTRGRAMPIALKNKAVKLQSPDGEAMNYLKHVQPVFDRNCIKCHDFGKPGAKRVILAGDMTMVFNASYISMWSQWKSKKPIIRPIGAGPAEILQPRTWGSHGSLLSKVYMGKHPTHPKITVPEADQHMLSMWQDLNCPYYPDYLSAYPNGLGGRCPLTGAQLKKLGSLTGKNLSGREMWGHIRKVGPLVSFSRPEISPCLAKLKKGAAKYKQALAIIQAGAAMLKKTPRAEMAGFVPCEDNRKRLEKYTRLMEQERASRDALRDGTKVYDPGLAPKK